MTTFQFEGDVDLGPDDNLLIGDNVRQGDVVYFERSGEREVIMRTFTEANLASFPGRAYRVERGDPPHAVKFKQLK